MVDTFVHFSRNKQTGKISYNYPIEVLCQKMLLPPSSKSEEQYDLQQLENILNFKDFGQITDVAPVLSETTDPNDEFYPISLERLRAYACGKEKNIDAALINSVTHLFVCNVLEESSLPTSTSSSSLFGSSLQHNEANRLLLTQCLSTMQPIMYKQFASLVPTCIYKEMRFVNGWIEGALHYFHYSLLFLEKDFAGFDIMAHTTHKNILDLNSSWYIQMPHRYVLGVSCSFVPIFVNNLFYVMPYEVPTMTKTIRNLFEKPNPDGHVIKFTHHILLMYWRNHILKAIDPGNINRISISKYFSLVQYNYGDSTTPHTFSSYPFNTVKGKYKFHLLLAVVKLENEADTFMYVGDDNYCNNNDNNCEDEELSALNVCKYKVLKNTFYIIPMGLKFCIKTVGKMQLILNELTNVYFQGTYISSTLKTLLSNNNINRMLIYGKTSPLLRRSLEASFENPQQLRIYKQIYEKHLEPKLLISRQLTLPMQYDRLPVLQYKFSYLTNGHYYYFKVANPFKVSIGEKNLILSLTKMEIFHRVVHIRRLCDDVSANDSCAAVTAPTFIYYQTYTDLKQFFFLESPSSLNSDLEYTFQNPSTVCNVQKQDATAATPEEWQVLCISSTIDADPAISISNFIRPNVIRIHKKLVCNFTLPFAWHPINE